jgi:hypothetical protein
MKTLNSIKEGLTMKMNRERLKMVLGSRDKNFVLFISFRNILKRIGGKI